MIMNVKHCQHDRTSQVRLGWSSTCSYFKSQFEDDTQLPEIAWNAFEKYGCSWGASKGFHELLQQYFITFQRRKSQTIFLWIGSWTEHGLETWWTNVKNFFHRSWGHTTWGGDLWTFRFQRHSTATRTRGQDSSVHGTQKLYPRTLENSKIQGPWRILKNHILNLSDSHSIFWTLMGTDVARLFKDLWAKVQPCFPPTLWRSGSCCLSHSGLHVLLRETELPFAVPSAAWTKQRERTYSTVGVCWSQISQDAPLDGATKQCVGHSMAALTELNQTKQTTVISCRAQPFSAVLSPGPSSVDWRGPDLWCGGIPHLDSHWHSSSLDFTHSVLQQFGYLWVLWVLRVPSFRLGWFRLISSAICLQDLDASEGFIAELFEPASQSKAIGHHWQIWEEAAICCNITCDICSVWSSQESRA